MIAIRFRPKRRELVKNKVSTCIHVTVNVAVLACDIHLRFEGVVKLQVMDARRSISNRYGNIFLLGKARTMFVTCDDSELL